MYINHICLKWKSEGVSFKQANKELIDNFKIVGERVTEENVKCNSEYIYKPKRIESQLTIYIVYDLETQNTDRARPYVFCFYRLSKLGGRYNRDITSDEKDKCNKDTMAFDGDNCVEESLDFCLKLNGEEYRDKKVKLLENNLQLHAHNGSGFDTWTVLKNLPCDKRIVNIKKMEKALLN